MRTADYRKLFERDTPYGELLELLQEVEPEASKAKKQPVAKISKILVSLNL